MDEQAWREKSVEILTDVKVWRRAHPKATYVEIEGAPPDNPLSHHHFIQAIVRGSLPTYSNGSVMKR